MAVYPSCRHALLQAAGKPSQIDDRAQSNWMTDDRAQSNIIPVKLNSSQIC